MTDYALKSKWKQLFLQSDPALIFACLAAIPILGHSDALGTIPNGATPLRFVVMTILAATWYVALTGACRAVL